MSSPHLAIVSRLEVKSNPPRDRKRHEFQSRPASKYLEQLVESVNGDYGLSLQVLYLGLAATVASNGQIIIAFSASDGTYNVDFAVRTLNPGGNSEASPINTPASGSRTSSAAPTPSVDDAASANIERFIITEIRKYTQERYYKFAGAGVSLRLAQLCPHLLPRLWLELDIIPFQLDHAQEWPMGRSAKRRHQELNVDEEADSMARKCVMCFGPTQQPRIMVGFQNEVLVDAGGHAILADARSYRASVNEKTWNAAMKYANALKDRNVKIAFFSSTPQGGGVALMRHALVRFFRIVGVDCRWYVPKPKPEVFRVTKTNHNILQGVADPEARLSDENKTLLSAWVEGNSQRLWLGEDGPLLKGGADVIIVDDPQMPDVVRIAKEQDPDRPVIFRSHIQIRSDLANKKGTPTSEVWQWLWEKVSGADVFISHPVREFIPNDVDVQKVAYMPATTDWLDGLNKHLEEYDSRYYINEFNTTCYKTHMTTLEYPKRPYIVQIARFDPSKGIPVVLAAFAELRRTHMADTPHENTPQLVIAGHGAVDDPDASAIYDQTMCLLEKEYSDLRSDVVVMRVGPTDQILNALMRNAYLALQLSTREGFEVKVSEALHAGIPIIASRAGGIPLQVQHEKSGFLVPEGEHKDAAKYMWELFKDEELYCRMSDYAKDHVSDEVGTVGNALCWMYLAEGLSRGEKIVPNSRWVSDMAREGVNEPYGEKETRLPRIEALDLTN